MTAVGPDRIEGYQLSPQQRAVFLREGARSRAVHAVRPAPPVALDELAARMETLVAEHEILRTRYAEVAGLRIPVQVVDPAGPVSAEEGPLGGTVLRAGELTVEHRDTPDGALLRLELPRLSVDRASWSMITGFLLGERPAGAAEDGQALQYADVAAWLGEELERSETAGEPEETSGTQAAVPFLTPAGRWDGDAVPETLSVTVEGPVPARLRTAARELAVSEAAILLAAWGSLHARYTRGGDGRMLVVTDGRSADGLGGVLGLLERPVAVRLPIAPEAPFARAARDAADALRDAAAHECHRDPGEDGGDGTGPVPSFRHRWDRWAAAAEPGPFGRAELPGALHLDCVQGPESLSLTFAGTGARVTASDLAMFAEAFEHLLTDALADSGRAVGVLRLTAPSGTPTAAPSRTPVVQDAHRAVPYRFLEQAGRVPDRPAVRCADEVLTYRELARRAEAVAALLRGHGVRPGDHVPVAVPSSADTLAAMLGTWLAGAAFVPIDPAWPKERIETVVRQSASPLALVPDAAAGIPLPVTAVPLPGRDDPRGGPAPVAADADGAAYVIFTSGTSGVPKGVVIGHDQLAHYTAAVLERLDLPDGAGFAAVSTLAADLSYTAVFPTLAGGGCVHLVDADTATDPEALAERLRANPVSAMKLVPSHLSALLAEASDPPALLPGEVLVLGGEVLPSSLHARLRELAPRLRVYNHYGPTETTIGASCLPLPAAVDERCASVPVGSGLGENTLTVVDDEGNPLPPWCPGEVLISGPGVGLGYLAELREGGTGFGERGGAGRYRSGDLGRLVPGLGVEIIGRLDDQVKLRGHRVRLGEIEELLRRRPGVTAAAVVARTDDDGLATHLDAYVVRADADGPAVKDLQADLGRLLPAALVPTGWQVLERLPLTRNGKVDRRALAPVESERARAGRPRDSVEQRLLVLWAEVLGIDDISPEDDFFDLGGHSLRAIKLISRTNGAFGCRLPMSSIFNARTVAAMADLVRGSDRQDSNLVPLRNGEGGSPVFCVHPGGGSTLSYWELARLLPADRRIVGVEAWGLHGRPPQEDFAGMAASYAEAIATSGDGPPVLVGWCFGGLMALETARALRRAGHEVAKLIVIDCPAPGYDDEDDEATRETQPLTESTLIGRFAWHYELELPSPLPPGPAAYELLLKAMQIGGHLPPTAGEEELRTLFDAYAANMTALERHFEEDGPRHPAPDYPVLLIRAEPDGVVPDRDRTWGWRSLVGPGLSFASVAADHHGVMRPPAVSGLAALVAQALGPAAWV
ncbi:hypothetical protein GCM10010517_63340 [Streptosporangium fragile]|uniref:Carrier domain-containing protein n=1 Tax=Streptosporangium fragile TaxID=46186 RepID=A0ABN3W7J1_9ACTN